MYWSRIHNEGIEIAAEIKVFLTDAAMFLTVTTCGLEVSFEITECTFCLLQTDIEKGQNCKNIYT